MKRNKWQYRTVSRTVQDFDWDEFKLAMLEYAEGEVLLRKKIEWDVGPMSRYFHGPIRKFIEAQERSRGSSKGQAEIKSDLKQIYGPSEERMLGKKVIHGLKSTGDYDFDEWVKFINDIDAFCQEHYSCGIPPAEKVE